ncbi:MAG TPA: TetR/AcrR family transcriptional regulator, partial [Pseudonocardiaceae bacterium]
MAAAASATVRSFSALLCRACHRAPSSSPTRTIHATIVVGHLSKDKAGCTDERNRRGRWTPPRQLSINRKPPMKPTIWNDSLAGHKERLREHIIDTAAELVRERGSATVPMSVLAVRAGIARATLYNYFPDIEAVLAALVAQEVTRFRTQLDKRLRAIADPVERLDRCLLMIHRWATQQRAQRGDTAHRATRHKLSGQVIAAMHQPVAELRDVLAAILTDGIAEHAFAADTSPQYHADLVLRLLLQPNTTTD